MNPIPHRSIALRYFTVIRRVDTLREPWTVGAVRTAESRFGWKAEVS
jgi:hypothetical protein